METFDEENPREEIKHNGMPYNFQKLVIQDNQQQWRSQCNCKDSLYRISDKDTISYTISDW